jgi:hypothetical protein
MIPKENAIFNVQSQNDPNNPRSIIGGQNVLQFGHARVTLEQNPNPTQ